MSNERNKQYLLALAIAEGKRRYLYPNSTSAEKATRLQELLNDILGQGSISVNILREFAEGYEETDLPSSRVVSQEKATHLREAQIDQGYNSITAGADTVFKIKAKDAWKNWSKLERLGRELTKQEELQQYEMLYQVLCNPEEGKGEMMWDISLSIANGRVDTFSQGIYVKYSPIDEELLRMFFDDAVKEGYIYKYNSRIAMIELLIASGCVTQMAYVEENGQIGRMLREPNEALLELAKQDIISTMPVASFLGLATDSPNWQGVDLAADAAESRAHEECDSM